LIGTLIYNPRTGEFTTKLGPIFSNLILADEINRAPAKVQSALLEAMQERRITISDRSYPLADPFLVLATQNLSDIFNSGIGDVVMEACATKILLANAEAANVQSRRLYEAVGLNDREIQIVQGAIPKRQYYIVSPEGRRLISLGLGGVALAFVGVNSPDDRKKVEEIMRAHPRTWQAEWLREGGLSDWADWWSEVEGVLERRVSA